MGLQAAAVCPWWCPVHISLWEPSPLKQVMTPSRRVSSTRTLTTVLFWDEPDEYLALSQEWDWKEILLPFSIWINYTIKSRCEKAGPWAPTSHHSSAAPQLPQGKDGWFCGTSTLTYLLVGMAVGISAIPFGNLTWQNMSREKYPLVDG